MIVPGFGDNKKQLSGKVEPVSGIIAVSSA